MKLRNSEWLPGNSRFSRKSKTGCKTAQIYSNFQFLSIMFLIVDSIRDNDDKSKMRFERQMWKGWLNWLNDFSSQKQTLRKHVTFAFKISIIWSLTLFLTPKVHFVDCIFFLLPPVDFESECLVCCLSLAIGINHQFFELNYWNWILADSKPFQHIWFRTGCHFFRYFPFILSISCNLTETPRCQWLSQ